MSHDYTALCTVVSRLAEHIDAVDEVADAANMLQHCFVMIFKPPLSTSTAQPSVDATGVPSASELASDEELKLQLVEAVRAFHINGRRRHAAFLQAETYHTQAALYIHELLTPLRGGCARVSFRQLQLASVQAIEAVLLAVGPANVRRCLPGVVSIASRYLQRAHRGKDSVMVRVAVVELLRQALTIALGSGDASCDAGGGGSAAWSRDTVVHLHTVMHPLLDPDKLTEASQDANTLAAFARLFADVVTTPVMREDFAHPFSQAVIVAYCVVANLYTLQTRGASRQPALVPLPGSVFAASVSACQAVRQGLWKLRGVPLLHLATTALRLHAFEPALLATDEPGVTLFLSVLRRCIGLVGTGMEPEALYTFHTPRRHPSGVVDEFLECLAHRLAVQSLSHNDDDDNGETPGERLTNAMLDMCEAVLQDWNLYALHPPTLYVLARAVLWQFAPPAKSDDNDMACRSSNYPGPEELIESGAFDQLWSIMGAPHLWNITEDEELCNVQQIHHRQVVAATTLRALSLAASDVMAHCGPSGAAQHSVQRFLTRTVYLVMEKAAAAEPVHGAAMRCLRAFAEVVCATTTRPGDEAADTGDGVVATSSAMTFFFRMSGLVVDEAARAVTVSFLRPAAASVLRGAVAFLTHAAATRDEVMGGGDWLDSALVDTVRRRLRGTAVREAVRQYDALRQPGRLSQMADFVTAVIAVAGDGCERARQEETATVGATARSSDSYTNDFVGDAAAGVRAVLAVLRDCFDLAALMHFASPPRAMDEESEDDTLQQLTAAEPRVQRLQLAVRDAMHGVLRSCSRIDAATPFVVQAVIRGLTVFLTTAEAATWATRVRDAAEADEGAAPRPSLPSLRWWDEDGDASSVQECAIQLPRSHLKTVYSIYLSFLAMLREPLAGFLGGTPRRAGERRRLAHVPLSPGVFALLAGMECLVLLATEFLVHRMVDEVLPVVLLWHERAMAPRVRTPNEERLQRAIREYVVHCLQLYPASLQSRVREMCAPYFTVTEDKAPVGNTPG